MAITKHLTLVCTATLSLFLSGCINPNKLTQFSYPEPSPEDSPVEYALSWFDFDTINYIVDNPLNRLSQSKSEIYKKRIHTEDGYQRLYFRWCSLYDRYYQATPPSLTDQLNKLCTMKGGQTVTRDGKPGDPSTTKNWCQKQESKEVLFVFYEGWDSKDGLNCQNTDTNGRQIYLAAPLADNPDGWKRFTNEHGFFDKTQSREEAKWNAERKAARKAEEQKRIQRDKEERARYEHALELAKAQRKADNRRILNTRGLRVCKPKYAGSVFPRFIGFVEDSANGKAKISVVEFQVTPMTSHVDFKPTITWEYPENWVICE